MFWFRPLPDIPRVPGLRLCGEAFANLLMVFEFLHNFGETLGFGTGILLSCLVKGIGMDI
jgi:hypothetical protein